MSQGSYNQVKCWLQIEMITELLINKNPEFTFVSFQVPTLYDVLLVLVGNDNRLEI